MIICYSGTPGSGKTYDAVRKILDNVKMGRVVYTNIEGFDDPDCQEYQKIFLNMLDHQYSVHVRYLTKDQIMCFWRHCEVGSMIVIDEIHKYFSNRDWATEENRGFTEWASTHRHYGYDLVMMTQSNEKVDKHIRSLIEWTYVYRKVNYFGKLIKQSYSCHAYAGDTEKGNSIQRNYRKYDKRIFNCYKSYVAKDMKELSIIRYVNVLKHPVFFLLPVVLIFTLYMVFVKSSIGTGDIFGVGKIKDQQAARIKETKEVNDKSPAVGSVGSVFEVRDTSEDLRGYVTNDVSEGAVKDGCIRTVDVVTENEHVVVEVCKDGERKIINGVTIYDGKIRQRDNIKGAVSMVSLSDKASTVTVGR